MTDVWWQLIKGKVLTTPPPPAEGRAGARFPRGPIPSVGEEAAPIWTNPLDFVSERASAAGDMGGDHTLWHYYNVILPAKRQKQYNQYIAEQKRKEKDKANPPKPVGVRHSGN